MNTIKLFVAGALFLLLHSNGLSAPPSQPQNVQQAWLGSESLLLWDDIPEATSYNVYRSDSTNTTWMLVGSSAVPRFRDPTWQFLPSFYTVTAVNADGESAGSELNTVSFVEQYMIAVYPPQQSDGTVSPTNALVRLATSNVNGGQGLIDWGLDPTNFTWFAINTNYLSYQWFFLTNLTPRTTYFYRLTSITSNRAGVNYLGSFSTLDTNHPPVAENFTAWGPVPTNGGWLGLNGYDSNQPPQSLTFRVISAPTNGTLSDIQPGWGWSGAIIMYTPLPGARGYDYFQFVVNNGTWDSAPGLVTLTNWFNSLPAITNGAFTAVEDTTTPFSIPAVDPEGDPLTFQFYSMNGTIAGTAPNLFFTPQTNFSGQTWLWYQVSDGYATSQGSFTVDVTPVNDPPEIMTNWMPALTTWEDQPLTMMLFVLDNDPLGPNEIVAVTPPAHGTLSGSQWNFIYTPNSNFFGIDQFTIVARELDGTTSDPATFTVEVQSMNDAPFAFDQNVTVFEDTPQVIVPTGFDVESDPLTFQVAQFPSHGWVEQTGTNFIYHPMTNFLGSDAFSFRAVDSIGFWSWESAWIQIQVVDANDAPVASHTHHNLHTDIIVSRPFNVTDLDGNTLFCEIVQPPLEGTVTVSGTNFTYTPAPDLFDYEASFTYRVSDGLAYSDEALVTLWIGNTNFTPIAQDQSETVRGNELTGFILSIQDQDFGEYPVGVLETPPTNGTVQLTNYGFAYYTPAAGFIGTDSFTYRPYDGFATGNLATVTITVTPPNLPPVANDSTVTVNEDSSINFNFSATDPNGDGLTYELVVTPVNGVLTGFGPTRNYQPVPNFTGTDSITFRVSDGQFYSANATVSITVNPVNDAPVASNSAVTVNEDSSVSITMNGSDLDNSIANCTFNIVTPPAHGTLGSGNRVRTYSPARNYFGPDSFTFQISDGAALSGIATVSINVLPVSDPPVAQFQVITNYEDTSFPITLLGSDPDGDPVTFGLMSQPYFGSLTGTPPNLTYIPLLNWNSGSPTITNVDTFFFTVFDGSITKSSVVTIVFLPVNDAPVANNQSRTTAEDTSVAITLTGSDVEGSALSFAIVSGPANGTLAGTPPDIAYTPNANFFGSDAFTFSVSDGLTNSTPATVNITVTPVNDLPAPENLRRRIYEDHVVRLWWNEVPGAQSYLIYRADETNGPFTLLASGIVATNFNDATAEYAHTYWYYVRTWDGTAEGQPSGAVLARPDTTGMITLFMNEWVIHGTTAIVQFVSSLPDGTEGIFEYGTDHNYGTTIENTNILPFQRFHLSNLVPATVYYFRITATDARGNAFVASTNLFTDYFITHAPPIAHNQTNTMYEDSLYGPVQSTLTATDPNGSWPPLTFALLTLPSHGTLTMSGESFTYVPETNFFGTDSFTFKASDGELDSAPGTVVIEVVPINDGPVVSDITIGMLEDTTVVIPITATDIENDTIAYLSVGSPLHGTVSVSGTNITYTPAPNFFGYDEFSFEAIDTGFGLGNTAWVRINVTNVNDAPAATSQSVSTPEDTAKPIMLSGTDTEGSALNFSAVAGPTHGTLSGTAPNLVYTPNANYNGSDSFTFIANDGAANSAEATVSITVTPVNDAPVAVNRTFSGQEDTAFEFTLGGTDIEGDALTVLIVSAPTSGTISGAGPTFTYTPNTNFNGTDSFFYTVNDGSTEGNTASVTITVAAVDDAPVANPDSITTNEDVPTEVVLTASDVDGGPIDWAVSTPPAHGTLSGTAPNLVYTPVANFFGSDSLVFRVSNGTTQESFATVSIAVNPVNDAPVANAQSLSTVEETALGITLGGSDTEGDGLSFTIVTPPSHGTLSGTAPNLIYTPAANYFGTDAFTFKVNDGAADSAPAQVSLTVTPVNDAPVANAQSVNTAEDTATPIALTANDLDGDALTYTVLTTPTHGSLSGTAPNLTYTPAANYFGSDSFTFRVNDGTVNSGTATISITVLSVNDAPVANAQSVTVTYNTAKAITLTGSDLEGGTLTYAIVSGPTNGALSGTAPNVTYTPTVGSAGADFFTFRVNDGSSNSAAATVSITTLNPTGIPSAPSGLNITVPTATGSLILNWNCSATNEDGFKIERSLNSGNGWGEIATTGINIHTFTNTGLTSGTRYYYRVRSYNRLGNSAYSNTKDAKPR